MSKRKSLLKKLRGKMVPFYTKTFGEPDADYWEGKPKPKKKSKKKK